MNGTKKEFSLYLENISLFLTGGFLVLLPVLFLSSTTDAFVLPKQIALSVATGLLVIVFGIKTIVEGKLRLKNSPFDLPVLLFTIVVFLSAIFSRNRLDSLIAFMPLFFLALLYYGIVNLVRREKQLLFLMSALIAGTVLSSLVTILSFFKLYPLPFAYSHVQYFTTFGSLLDQALYLALVLPIAGYFLYAFRSKNVSRDSSASSFVINRNQTKVSPSIIGFGISFALIALSLGITIYMLTTTQKPLILPFDTGLQTGLSSLSQDSTSVFKSFLLGSGFGTYITDFTRFKSVGYNLNPNLWSFTFFRSSSFLLELLATTGLLGFVSFLFIIFKIIKERTFFLPLVVTVIGALVLPFSFTLLSLFFIMLAIFAVIRMHNDPERFNEMEFYVVALRKGFLAIRPEGEQIHQNSNEKRYSKLLPIVFMLVLVAIVGVPLYFTTKFMISDLTFQKSLVAASKNNGLETYNLQVSAIQTFPYRDIYHRSFSQTNLALANSLATTARQKNASPSAQQQQQIVQLIQQSINSGRTAVAIAPLTTFNWNNLSAIYRGLIGFGQNADQFTVLTAQQAIALDPNNPQQYIELGGIYYQLGQYDDAIRQFQIAINQKQDYANAYYNLGHAYEAKKDTKNALAAYQVVEQLVSKDEASKKKIAAEIAALTKKAANGETSTQTASQSAQTTPDLNVNQPTNALPETKPEVKIPGPSETPTPSPKTGTTPTPSL